MELTYTKITDRITLESSKYDGTKWGTLTKVQIATLERVFPKGNIACRLYSDGAIIAGVDTVEGWGVVEIARDGLIEYQD